MSSAATSATDWTKPRSADPSNPIAKPFDVIVIGGVTFGSVPAQHIFFEDKRPGHRTLLLEGGLFCAARTCAKSAVLDLNNLAPTSTADLRTPGNLA